jgi:hypothetical protein
MRRKKKRRSDSFEMAKKYSSPNGEQIITHRQGDIYFGRIIMDLPFVPIIYRKYLEKDYESKITLEERTFEFLCVGNPKNKKRRLDLNKGIVMKLFLDNLEKEFNRGDIERSLGKDDLTTTLWRFEDFKDSQCFELICGKKKNGHKPFSTYTLISIEPTRKYLEKLERWDVEFGLNGSR